MGVFFYVPLSPGLKNFLDSFGFDSASRKIDAGVCFSKSRLNALPKLCRNKWRDAAFVYCGKRKIYLGKWGAPETIAAYRRYIAELASDRVSVGDGAETEKNVVTVAELAVAFLSDKKDYYVKDGASTRQHERYRVALSFPVEFFPATPVDDFGPKKLLFCRDEMKKSGRFARSYINTLINCVRTVFRWGVGLELVRPETLVGLQAVPPLKRDKSTAREVVPIEPVPGPVVDATLPFLPDRVAAMVRLQRLTGMRPGEVCAMRSGDVDRSGAVWIYTLRTDKTAHRRAASAKKRVPLGRRAQAILTPYLVEKADDPDAFLRFLCSLAKLSGSVVVCKYCRTRPNTRPSRGRFAKRRR